MLIREEVKMKIAIVVILLSGVLVGCSPGMYDDNLSAVPVTNNPNIIPRSQTAQGPGF